MNALLTPRALRFILPSLLVITLYIVIVIYPKHTIAENNEINSLSNQKTLVYLNSDIRIPFWSILSRGIEKTSTNLGYHVIILSADNSAKQELELAVQAINNQVAGIILSPTTSSAAVTVLKLANQANIPVVIADIGADSNDYISYIASDNQQGAYHIGKILTATLITKGWQQGSVGIIAIPQKRANGRARTTGFMQALKEENIRGAGIEQQIDFSYEETYRFSKAFIDNNPDLRALWLQGSDRYQAALDAIADADKQNEILLICFDAEPEFLELIPQGKIVAAAMQQPYLMGQEAVHVMDNYLNGQSVRKEIKLPVLSVSADTIADQLPLIRRNVLGIEPDRSSD